MKKYLIHKWFSAYKTNRPPLLRWAIDWSVCFVNLQGFAQRSGRDRYYHYHCCWRSGNFSFLPQVGGIIALKSLLIIFICFPLFKKSFWETRIAQSMNPH
jgi:hypothetical protein